MKKHQESLMILVLIRCLSYELTAKTGTKQRKENSEKVSEIKQFKGYTRCRVLFTGKFCTDKPKAHLSMFLPLSVL